MKTHFHILLRTAFVVFTLLLPFARLRASASEPELQVLGFLEDVTIHPEALQFRAKLDTGADTSSLHAEDMEFFERDGEDWVRFTAVNRYGEPERLERAVRRFASIKSKRSKSQRRPVIRLAICLADEFEVVEVTLVDRSNFSSEVLIGRNFLSGKVLVDSSTTYTSIPECEKRARFVR